MNKLLNITAVSLAIFIALSSCKKDDKAATNDDYYVKYVIKGNGTYAYFSNFSVNTDQGNRSFSGYQYRSWNQTYGPVKKGFRASVSVNSSLVTVEIYVNKNSGPFALKASKSGSNSSTSNISQSYTIDF
ncbi:hypothetical protein [Ferruginibacter sp. HRS2-29]|uniref:hypothetical protein n=1 Tax=Ferruginibacter sp. HRS2-29 TaxID=2487334 RepID=UPI0020CE2C2F|nr:hypothetical protein [Ferruginibacter sp. HRS2-29]MCP9751201.1 hypothetical protein [Ferruginibacter sp. HRS2-29]